MLLFLRLKLSLFEVGHTAVLVQQGANAPLWLVSLLSLHTTAVLCICAILWQISVCVPVCVTSYVTGEAHPAY